MRLWPVMCLTSWSVAPHSSAKVSLALHLASTAKTKRKVITAAVDNSRFIHIAAKRF